MSCEILKEHLTPYFKYVDSDYKDLSKILGIDPLEVTILRCGTFDNYYIKNGKGMRSINPSMDNIRELLQLQTEPPVTGRWNISL